MPRLKLNEIQRKNLISRMLSGESKIELAAEFGVGLPYVNKLQREYTLVEQTLTFELRDEGYGFWKERGVIIPAGKPASVWRDWGRGVLTRYLDTLAKSEDKAEIEFALEILASFSTISDERFINTPEANMVKIFAVMLERLKTPFKYAPARPGEEKTYGAKYYRGWGVCGNKRVQRNTEMVQEMLETGDFEYASGGIFRTMTPPKRLWDMKTSSLHPNPDYAAGNKSSTRSAFLPVEEGSSVSAVEDLSDIC